MLDPLAIHQWIEPGFCRSPVLLEAKSLHKSSLNGFVLYPFEGLEAMGFDQSGT
jgi:hypothetical protein